MDYSATIKKVYNYVRDGVFETLEADFKKWESRDFTYTVFDQYSYYADMIACAVANMRKDGVHHEIVKALEHNFKGVRRTERIAWLNGEIRDIKEVPTQAAIIYGYMRDIFNYEFHRVNTDVIKATGCKW